MVNDGRQPDSIAIRTVAFSANRAISPPGILRLVTSYILGIHTSTPTLALGVLDLDSRNTGGDRSIQSRHWLLDRQMSSQLHPCLQDFFPPEQWNQLVAIAVAVGPGSFTSCRMGVTVARTLGQSLDIPVFGLSSLAAIAAEHLDTVHQNEIVQPAKTVAVQMDAKRGEWFGGIYRSAGQDRTGQDMVTTVGDRLWSEADWKEVSSDYTTIVAGDWESHPPVEALLRLAAKQYSNGQRPLWANVLPFYGRKPPIHNG